MRVRTGRLKWLRSCWRSPCHMPGFAGSGSARLVHSLPRPCGLHPRRLCGELHLREHLRLSYLDNPRAIPSTPSVLRFQSQLHQPCLRLLRPLLTSRSSLHRRPFRHEARSPQVRTHSFTAQPPDLRHLSLDHESFAVYGPLALLGNAFYPVLVHRLAIYAPRFLPTLGRPHAVALHFVRCDQLTAGLAPAGVRPCWAHQKNPRRVATPGLIFRLIS